MIYFSCFIKYAPTHIIYYYTKCFYLGPPRYFVYCIWTQHSFNSKLPCGGSSVGVEGYWVVRLSLGKLLVNLLRVVKRTNTPPIPSQMASSARPWFFSGRGFSSPTHPSPYNKPFQTFPDRCHVELEKYSPRHTHRKWNRLDFNTSARISGRPAIPPFQGGGGVS